MAFWVTTHSSGHKETGMNFKRPLAHFFRVALFIEIGEKIEQQTVRVRVRGQDVVHKYRQVG